MTISSTPSVPVSINTAILLAYKRAGVLPVEATTAGPNMAAKLAHGRQLLDLIIDGLAIEGFMARTQRFYDLTIVAGTSSYTLPDTILDVIEDGMFHETATPETELVCSQMDMATWQLLTVKTAESSRPQMYLAKRDAATIVIQLWPIPTEAGVLRLKSIRLFGGNATGTDSPDLQRYWYDALVWQLAYYVAVDSSMPTERVSFLASMAESKKKDCVRYNFEHTPIQASIAYTTQWSQ